MEEILIEIISMCDKRKYDVLTHKDMSPSSSVKDIAKELCRYLQVGGVNL